MAVKELPISEEIDDLVYVKYTDGHRGWRVDLLADKLKENLEETILVCSVCGGLLRKANIIVIEGKQELRCFACNPFKVGLEYTPMSKNQEAVDKRIVVCPLKKRGCGWKGQLNGLLEHLESCVYILVFCPRWCVNKENKLLILERRLMVKHVIKYHVRELACNYSSKMLKTYEIDLHQGSCAQYPIPCPKKCNERVPRNSVETNLAVGCPLEVVKCPYWEYGCEERMDRKQVDQHEREYLQSHFKLTCISTKKTQAEQTEKIQKLETENKQKDLKLNKLKRAVSFVIPSFIGRFVLNQINSKISKGETTYTDPFYVGLYRCRTRIDLGVKTGFMSCFLCIMKGEWDDKLVWPVRFKLQIALLNRESGRSNVNDSVNSSDITREDLQSKSFGFPTFKPIASLLKNKYNRNDCIGLTVIVDKLGM